MYYSETGRPSIDPELLTTARPANVQQMHTQAEKKILAGSIRCPRRGLQARIAATMFLGLLISPIAKIAISLVVAWMSSIASLDMNARC